MFCALLTRLRGLLQRPRVAREMDSELRFHVEMETQANVDRGIPQPEARRLALRDLGGVEQTKETIRDVRASWVDSVWQDARLAFRSLWRRPGSGLTAVAMLGVGIGLTTAMFTLVDALLLRPVPFDEPDQLAFVFMGDDRGGRTTVAPEVLRAWRESPAFAGAEAAVPDTALVEVRGTVVTRGIARITPGLFNLLGEVRPVLGRLFDASDAGATDRVILSEDLWRGLYDADPAVAGRRITVDEESLVVVGVLPSEFRFPSWDTVLWRAADFAAASARDQYPMAYVRFDVRVPREDALRIATEAARAADPKNAGLRPHVRPLAGFVLDSYYQRAVPLLAGGVVLVFLVLCANVCSLLLARLTARQREFAMRSALGGARARLVRQAFVESSVLAVLSVIAGIGIGWTLVSLTRAFLPEAFLLRTLNPLNVDVRALAVTSVSGVIAMLTVGLLPAWIGTRVGHPLGMRCVPIRWGCCERNKGPRHKRHPCRSFLLTIDKRSGYRRRVDCRGRDQRRAIRRRLAAGHAGYADPENAGSGTSTRLGHLATHSTGLRSRAPRQSRVALPRAPPPGTAGLAVVLLGSLGKQPTGEVLPTDTGRAPAAPERTPRVDTAVRRGRSHHGDDLSRGYCASRSRAET